MICFFCTTKKDNQKEKYGRWRWRCNSKYLLTLNFSRHFNMPIIILCDN